MTHMKPSRQVQILTLGLVFLLGTFSVPAAAENNPSGKKTINGTTLSIMASTFLAYSLTPLPKWQTEIQKLHADELFVQRWMLLNNDDASLAKGKRALENIHKERKALKKKRDRFLKWFHLAMVIAGTGIGLFTVWLKGGVS